MQALTLLRKLGLTGEPSYVRGMGLTHSVAVRDAPDLRALLDGLERAGLLKTWPFRPYEVNGSPHSFCYLQRLRRRIPQPATSEPPT